ncbi:ABC transporter ATP-binding protein [Ketogulonicigenium vulgare]|uniref:ABC Fe+3 hydroxamate (Ferrichrome) transporter, ATPase subunit n=1 Tax=Ketogulonicigenium vulgare (strain WSH-001) TaxID=759362 RepID=F9YB98_KETVW|nr:ATP-binding cassette domain-containing protein [Ketogulonicigenium vulgare]ADO44126.1 ABC transporter related protein [Ketogulonicigenium vulgare Y25]AEM42650.1 ABC Fe+3 hydroxamate (Ferrichrome) transporter, ATPase subunit [Ketogulonicigenium vulgare WSH-001]ALJ82455.1 iron ABC transporter substrate-binding protein [Ketogulonicigenium vulgare]ANW35242.1 iron ABC transporter substrate-binding protein [Ketogulonicigenium vulgare]AOZ53352.1 ABC transporter related protein [Ketogulonicigenium 
MRLFSVQNLTYDVPNRRLIDGLNVAIQPARVTALIGRNGSSKSTLLKLIAGQTTPSGGTITYRDRPLASIPPRQLARELAYLPQVTPPADGMQLEELVALGRYPWRGALGRFRPEDHAAVADAITRCGLTHLRGQLIDTMSGGERQRAWIAMMLAQGAETLLLDEPISALDIAHQVEVLGLLQRMSRETGMSVIIVLHDVNMVARYCDHVIALAGGKLVLDAPTADLMTPDALHAIYGLPMQVSQQSGTAFALPV